MKLRLIIVGIMALLLVSLAIANKDSLQDLFLNNIDTETKDKVLNIINSMTPQQALELRIREISEQNKVKEIKEESAE